MFRVYAITGQGHEAPAAMDKYLDSFKLK